MSRSLWPDLKDIKPKPGIAAMLEAAAGDIDARTNGRIIFYVDIVRVVASEELTALRHNCYLHVPSRRYNHLLFQVTANPQPPFFPCQVATPERSSIATVNSEEELRQAVGEVLRREHTKDVVEYLLSLAPVTATEPA